MTVAHVLGRVRLGVAALGVGVLLQPEQREVRRVQHADQVDVDGAQVGLGGLVGRQSDGVLEAVRASNTGVGDDDVDAARRTPLDGLLEQVDLALPVGDIALHKQRLGAGRGSLNVAHRLLAAGLVDVAHDNVGAALGPAQAEALAEAGRAARDQHRLALEPRRIVALVEVDGVGLETVAADGVRGLRRSGHCECDWHRKDHAAQ